eukprot:5008873-Lingulodinium_polyedra.AAC.1
MDMGMDLVMDMSVEHPARWKRCRFLQHSYPFLLGSGAAVPVFCKPAPMSPRISVGCDLRSRKAKMVM